MNTFLPSHNFEQIARILDFARLNRQISECAWIAHALANKPTTSIASKSTNHPVFKLWKEWGTDLPLIGWLRKYQLALYRAWKQLSKSKVHQSVIDCRWMDNCEIVGQIVWPAEVHISHRVALLTKNYSYYSMMFQCEGLPINEEYIGYAWLQPTIVRNKK